MAVIIPGVFDSRVFDDRLFHVDQITGTASNAASSGTFRKPGRASTFRGRPS